MTSRLFLVTAALLIVLEVVQPACEAVDIHYANTVPGGFPALSEELLLESLQNDDDDGRTVWLDCQESPLPAPRPRQMNPSSCYRPCEVNGPPMVCYFRWRVESFATMSRACGDCPRNVTDCTAPQCITADGYERGILVVNRKLPGPSINVCKGDIVVVDVKNMMPGRSTTIHWHGILQRGTPHMDGVPMVTQCPIPENGIFRYRFAANEVGTQFWHSHDGLQKMDGIVGSLVVRGPRSEDVHGHRYDFDLRSHTVVITDWFHLDADQRFPGLRRREVGQLPDSYLVNGRGSYRLTVDSEAPYSVLRVSRGRRYRLRLIGATCTSCAAVVTIENHRMMLIYTDITPVEPVMVDSVTILPGERYDVVVIADQPPAAYWIHVRGVGACALVGAHQAAVLRYSQSPQTMPSSAHPGVNGLAMGVTLNPDNSVCDNNRTDEVCVSHLRSLWPASPGILDAPPTQRHLFVFGFKFFTDDELYRSGTFHRFFNPPVFPPSSALLNNVSNMMGPAPLLTQIEDIPQNLFCTGQDQPCLREGFCECLNLIKVPLGSVIELVIADFRRVRGALSHPFHIHGHYFHILAQGLFEQGQTLEDIGNLLEAGQIPISYLPVQKDTIAVPSGGYVVVRMVADNPGFWIFHCHFLYHLATGMSAVFQVGELDEMVPPPAGFPKCGDFF